MGILASSTFILIRTVLRVLHFSLLLLFVYLFQPVKLGNLFRLVLGAPYWAFTNSGFFFNCDHNYHYTRTIYMELGHYHLFNMRFYYLPVKPTLQSRRLMAWGQLNITCWTTADPFNNFSLQESTPWQFSA